MLTLMMLSGLAVASVRYPADLKDQLGMPCAPQCVACHATNAGGGGTVTREFGMALVDRGLRGGAQTDLLIAALASSEADGVDSDGDGVIDVDELAVGDDPNGGDAFCGDSALPTPKYGCFNQAQGGFGLLTVGAAALLRRRRAR